VPRHREQAVRMRSCVFVCLTLLFTILLASCGGSRGGGSSASGGTQSTPLTWDEGNWEEANWQ